jgi:hypothetical protein
MEITDDQFNQLMAAISQLQQDVSEIKSRMETQNITIRNMLLRQQVQDDELEMHGQLLLKYQQRIKRLEDLQYLTRMLT